MIRLLIKNKAQLEENVQKHAPEGKEIYINIPLTAKDAVTLLNHFPQLKTINTTPSAYSLTSRKIKNAFKQSGITFRARHSQRGRPKKYSSENVTALKKAVKNGKPIKETANKLKIPLRTAYALVKEK